MAITYSWSFSELDAWLGPVPPDNVTDVVYTIHWRLSATDGEDPPHKASCIGTATVTYDPDGPDPFIPFEDLTEADVLAWTEEYIGEEQLESYREGLAVNITEQETPTHKAFRTMPWNEGDGA